MEILLHLTIREGAHQGQYGALSIGRAAASLFLSTSSSLTLSLIFLSLSTSPFLPSYASATRQS